ncbi:glycosyltransferase family 2 protein [Rhizobium sp. FY34]|uniref:glycosyltransferase family 2 protein n=1 Tax=Rhizobium sp. FY34 TaxID=2562309 RepID=UPI0010BF76C7|nr:glycosyltransferase family 2 protein [Rhizobium sp. FY34]
MRSGLDQSLVHVDIGVCTFRRPELQDTLASLFALVVPADIRIRLIIADNDETPSASELVDSLRARSPFELVYVHCPKSNISIARNACLAESDGDYLVFIDDDETAAPEWLAALLDKASETAADAVLGPVRALYDEGAPDWMREGDFHSTRPVWVGGEIRTGYTCNVLLDMRSPRIRGRRFALALGQSGGEDTHFFTQVTDIGGSIVFAEQALLEEKVPAKRASLGWLMKRRFRSGQTHGRIVGARHSLIQRIKHIGLAMLKAGFCGMAFLGTSASPITRNRYLLRATLHCGAISGIMGMREIRQYGSMEAA